MPSSWKKPANALRHLGLTLAESKQLLKTLQQHVLERQATAFVQRRTHCQTCGKAPRTKRHHTITFRILFGTVTLTSPRLRSCGCSSHEAEHALDWFHIVRQEAA
jgi:hypothetical protein